jgi:hypothetical protein
VIYPCENLEDTKPCGAPATNIVRTPFSVRLVCDRCHYIFEAQGRDVKPLEFTCDWPVGGRECGEKATRFIIVSDYPSTHQRPLCAEHAAKCPEKFPLLIDDENFDPKLVPYKPPAQSTPTRIHHKADGEVILRCHCGKVGRFRPNATNLPLCDEHAPPKRPLRDRILERTQAILDHLSGARQRRAAAAEAELIRRVTEAKATARRRK